MFDTVIVTGLKLKQPKEVAAFLKKAGANFPTEFQTKDLENSLTTYHVAQDGSMTHTVHKSTGRMIKNNREPFKPFPHRYSSFLEEIYNKYCYRQLNERYPAPHLIAETKPVTEKYTLTDTFHIYCYDEINGRYLSLDYSFTANDGQVTKTTLTHWNIESEREAYRRKKRDQEWKQQMDQQQQKQQILQAQWYYPVLREIYNPIVFFGIKLLQCIGSNLIKLTYQWSKI